MTNLRATLKAYTPLKDRILERLDELREHVAQEISSIAEMVSDIEVCEPPTDIAALRLVEIAPGNMTSFLSRRCVRGPTRETPTVDLYDAWVTWCHEMHGDGGVPEVALPAFSKDLRAAGIKVRRKLGKSVAFGVELRHRGRGANPSLNPRSWIAWLKEASASPVTDDPAGDFIQDAASVVDARELRSPAELARWIQGKSGDRAVLRVGLEAWKRFLEWR